MMHTLYNEINYKLDKYIMSKKIMSKISILPICLISRYSYNYPCIIRFLVSINFLIGSGCNYYENLCYTFFSGGSAPLLLANTYSYRVMDTDCTYVPFNKYKKKKECTPLPVRSVVRKMLL